MHLNNSFISCCGMKSIHILSYEMKVILKPIFKFSESKMTRVRFSLKSLLPAFFIKVQTITGALLNASGVATSSTLWFSHKPPASRKVLRPDSALIPAPVKTRKRVSLVTFIISSTSFYEKGFVRHCLNDRNKLRLLQVFHYYPDHSRQYYVSQLLIHTID